jgi:hypothetical protein
MANVIANSSYYVMDAPARVARIYDQDGNLLQKVPLDESELPYTRLTRVTLMLDDKVTGKARPTRIVYVHNPIKGLCISFYDKNGLELDTRPCENPFAKEQKYYSEVTDLKKFLEWYPQTYLPYEFDSDWVREHNIPIESSHKESCLVM